MAAGASVPALAPCLLGRACSLACSPLPACIPGTDGAGNGVLNPPTCLRAHTTEGAEFDTDDANLRAWQEVRSIFPPATIGRTPCPMSAQQCTLPLQASLPRIAPHHILPAPPPSVQVFGQRHYWSCDVGPAVFIGLGTVRHRSNSFSPHEVRAGSSRLLVHICCRPHATRSLGRAGCRCTLTRSSCDGLRASWNGPRAGR